MFPFDDRPPCPSCFTCKFWLALDAEGEGACQRRPPEESPGQTSWPLTCEADWCGEFVPRLTVIRGVRLLQPHLN